MSKTTYTDLITKSIKKKESKGIFHYGVDVIVLDTSNVIHNGIRKALDVEKKIFEASHFTMNKPVFNKISSKYVSCVYTIDFYELPSNLIERFTIKGVDMKKLIEDLGKSNIDVNKCLADFDKHHYDLKYIMDYFTKNNMEITSLLSIMYKNGATMGNILANPSIYNIIKNSEYKWMLKENNVNAEKKITKRMNVFSVYNIQDEKNINIQSIYWTLIK